MWIYRLAALLLSVAIAGSASLPTTAAATDSSGGQRESLQVELRGLRGQVERAPRATGYDLDRAQRRVSWLRTERPRDPAVWHLQREIRDLRWRADRAARRASLGSTSERGPAGGEPAHGFRQPPPGDLQGERLPLGTGQRLILIQNGLRGARADLETGPTGQAGRHLTRVEQELDGLIAHLGATAAADPNLIAARAEIGRLRDRSAE